MPFLSKRSVTRRTRLRLIKLSIVLFITAITISALSFLNNHAFKFTSGWLTFLALAVLMLFSLRKKINFLPLGSAANWAQIHYYLGFFTSIIFLVHTDIKYATGTFNLILALSMFLTITTGFFGILISRIYPPILAKRGQQILYERIPSYRKEIQNNVEMLITQTLKETKSSTLVDFYNTKLLSFLSTQQNFFLHLIDSIKPSHKWKLEFNSVREYLNEGEKKSLNDIEDLTRAKITLDLNQSVYQILRYWLFVHIPLSYLTLILACIHAIQMTSYSTY